MLELPFLAELASAERVLLVGAGGGFDIFSALPLYFGLRRAGKEAFLANLTFTNLYGTHGEWLTRDAVEVTADAGGNVGYFPERYLAEWFRANGEEVPVYCLVRTGARRLRAAYEAVIGRNDVDTVVLVDGGTDSLMRGDEYGLGTPCEDIISLAAAAELGVERKYLVCLGFGVDDFHGVCHAHVLEAVADLAQRGAYLGAFSLLREMPEVRQFRAASMYVFERMPDHVSIVTSSILSAIEGHFGNCHSTQRTAGSELFINPLMGLYWCFRLMPVAERVVYLDAMKRTETWAEVDRVVFQHLADRPEPRPPKTIPL
jgi:hypothetical protein